MISGVVTDNIVILLALGVPIVANGITIYYKLARLEERVRWLEKLITELLHETRSR